MDDTRQTLAWRPWHSHHDGRRPWATRCPLYCSHEARPCYRAAPTGRPLMPAPTYSDEVLEQTPERVTKFLSGLGAVPTIRTLLAQAGMSDDDIIEGRT